MTQDAQKVLFIGRIDLDIYKCITEDIVTDEVVITNNQIESSDNIQMVLRICTSKDPKGYKNSIISSWKISEKRLQNYLRNKRILYKKH